MTDHPDPHYQGADVVADLLNRGDYAAALSVEFANAPIPGVRLHLENHDEVYLFITQDLMGWQDIMQLVELVGACGADECTLDGDHIRLWWD